jgi:hypothetical protein
MTDFDLLVYLMLFMLSVLWSSLALSKNSGVFSLISFISWFFMADVHLILGVASDLFALAYMYMGFGLMFLVLGIAFTVTNVLNSKRENDFWMI